MGQCRKQARRCRATRSAGHGRGGDLCTSAGCGRHASAAPIGPAPAGLALPVLAKGSGIPPDVLAKAIAQIREKERLRRDWGALFGSVTAPPSTHFDGSRLIGVGRTIYRGDPNLSWHGFLYDFLLLKLGEEWRVGENAKPLAEVHILARWLGEAMAHEAATDAATAKHQAPTPGIWAARSVAYDALCVEQQQPMPADLIRRLRHRDHFEGARYELWVAACFVRAGFKLEFEDEADGATTHCEFSAKHPDYEAWFSVEAKRRHRPIEGAPEKYRRGDYIKLDIGRLIAAALAKRAPHQHLIFLDINMPPTFGSLQNAPWVSVLFASRKSLEKQRRFRSPDAPSAFIFVTNHPYHYLTAEIPDPRQHFAITPFNLRRLDRNPALTPIEHPAVMHLAASIRDHFAVPSDFLA